MHCASLSMRGSFRRSCLVIGLPFAKVNYLLQRRTLCNTKIVTFKVPSTTRKNTMSETQNTTTVPNDVLTSATLAEYINKLNATIDRLNEWHSKLAVAYVEAVEQLEQLQVATRKAN